MGSYSQECYWRWGFGCSGGLVTRCSKAIKEARLVERKIYFLLDAGNWCGRRVYAVQRPIPHLWQSGARHFIGWGRGLHAETAVSLDSHLEIGHWQSEQCHLDCFQFSSVAQSCLTLWDPMMQHTGLPCPSPTPGAYSDSCLSGQWCQSTISSSVIPPPLAFNLSQHQGLIKWVSSLNQVAKVLELQLQHQSFQWIFRTDFL